jgi:hypothetical protein
MVLSGPSHLHCQCKCPSGHVIELAQRLLPRGHRPISDSPSYIIKASRGVRADDFAYFRHANGCLPEVGRDLARERIIRIDRQHHRARAGQPEKIRNFNGRFAKTLPAFSNLSDSRPEIVGRVQEVRRRGSSELRIG